VNPRRRLSADHGTITDIPGNASPARGDNDSAMNTAVRHRILAALPPVAAALLLAPVAQAQPAPPTVGAACTENLAGALTRLPDRTPLQCAPDPGFGYHWRNDVDAYPSSDRWLSYGPPLIVHGEGTRNREVSSGQWTGYPQDADTVCAASQQSVLGPGDLTQPQVATGEPGQPLSVPLLPQLFTVEFSGNCLWQQA
jgi:hypothetical protein